MSLRLNVLMAIFLEFNDYVWVQCQKNYTNIQLYFRFNCCFGPHILTIFFILVSLFLNQQSLSPC